MKNYLYQDAPVDKIIIEYVENMILIADSLPEGVIITASLIENILPPDILPAGDSILIQLMVTALYDELGNESPVAEALCRIDIQELKTLQKTAKWMPFL